MDKIGAIKMLVPKDEIIQKYNDKTVALLETMKNNTEENQKLSSLRNWLLPMLMNGQVTVNY